MANTNISMDRCQKPPDHFNMSGLESWTHQAGEQHQAILLCSCHRTVMHPAPCKWLRQERGRTELEVEELLQARTRTCSRKEEWSSQTTSLASFCSHHFLSSVSKIKLMNLWDKTKALPVDQDEQLQSQLQCWYCTRPSVGIPGSGTKTSYYLSLGSSQTLLYICVP